MLSTDGALAAETPTAASDLKIILSGKFLEPGQILDGEQLSSQFVRSQLQLNNTCLAGMCAKPV